MTNAITGNSMIPSNPGIAAQQAKDGASFFSPQQSGGTPPREQQATTRPVQEPQQPSEDYDHFWENIEERLEVPPDQQAGQPSYPEPQQPQEASVPQGRPQYPEQTPQQPGQLTPEQMQAIADAQAYQQPQQPQLPQQTPQQQTNQQLEENAIAQLAATEYALPDEMAQQMVAEPEKVYPQLAARLHVRLASQIGAAVQQLLPAIIDQRVNAVMTAQKLEADFYKQYPQLDREEFKPVVLQALRTVRQFNPQASREQVMQDGAAFAAMRLRLQLNQPQGNGQAVAQHPQAQAQPVQMRQPTQPAYIPMHQPPQQAFQPAVGGGGSLPNIQSPEPENEFERMAMDPNW